MEGVGEQMDVTGTSGRPYRILKTIFKSERSVVFRATCYDQTKDLAMNVAIKLVYEERVRGELEVLQRVRQLNSPYLLKLLDTIRFDEKKVIGLVFRLYDMSLLDFFSTNKMVTHRVIKHILWQVATGIQTLHINGIAHLDIKLENIMINDKYDIVIIDFGYSEIMGERQVIDRFCGSYMYVSPEQISLKVYDPLKSDVWSFGILMFVCLCSRFPFRSEKDSVEELFASIASAPVFVPNTVVPRARDLISRILDRNPKTRVSMADVLEHTWFTVTNNLNSNIAVNSRIGRKSHTV